MSSSTSVTIEVVRHVTVRTPQGGNDEREVKLNPNDDHDHDEDDNDDDGDGDDHDEDDELVMTMMMRKIKNQVSSWCLYFPWPTFQTNKLLSMYIISTQHVLVL